MSSVGERKRLELTGAAAIHWPRHWAWPWRGLLWALLLALAMHMGAVSLMGSSLSVHAARLETHGFQMRLIQALAEATPSAQPPAEPPKPALEPSPAVPEKPAQTRVGHRAAAQPVRAIQEEKSALALADTARDAIDIEAIGAPAAPAHASADALPAAGSAPAAASLLYPPSMSLQFEGLFVSRGLERHGTASLQWATDGHNYQLKLQASALIVFSRQESSAGLITPQGLAPQRYTSSRTGRSEQATHFLRDAGKIQFSANKPPASLLAGAQDRLSVLVQLAAGFAGDPGLEQRAQRLVMQVAGPDSAELWEFKLEGRERLVLPAGELDTLKLSRVHRHEYDANLYLWLAPQLGFLPVRILQSARSAAEQDFTDLRLRALP